MQDFKNAIQYINILSYKHKVEFFLLVLFYLILAILDSGAIIQTLSNYDKNNFSSLKFLCFIILLTTILRLFLQYFFSLHLKSVGYQQSKKVFEYIINYDYEEFIQQDKKDLKNTITYRLNQLIHGVHTSILQIIVSLISLPFFIISFSSLFGKNIILISTLLLAILYVVYSQYKQHITTSNKVADKANGNVLELVSNMLSDPRSLKIYNLEKTFTKNYLFNVLKIKNTQASNIFFTIIPRTSAELIIYGIASFAFLVLTQDKLLLLVGYAPILFISLSRVLPLLTALNINLITLKASHVALEVILEYEKKRENKPLVLQRLSSKLISLEVVNYNNVIYTYPNKREKTLNIKEVVLKKDSPLIIKGPSGLGKSTLIDIMCGLLENKNISISYVSNNKRNLLNLNSHLLKRNSSYCGQTNFLIPGTLKDNLISKETRQLKKNEIYELLEEFNLSKINLSTIINDGKDLVSGGQKQRINILRVLIEKRSLLFMDEPSSALDKNNVNKLIRLIDKLTKERLVAIVSHDEESFIKIKNARMFDLELLNRK